MKAKETKKDQRFLMPPSQCCVTRTTTFRASAERAGARNDSTTHQTSFTPAISDNRRDWFCIVSSRADRVVPITLLVNYYSDVTTDQFHLLIKATCTGAYNGYGSELQQQSSPACKWDEFPPLEVQGNPRRGSTVKHSLDHLSSSAHPIAEAANGKKKNHMRLKGPVDLSLCASEPTW